ncbi:MAG: serine hydrolase, partial [Candidatus Cybelea sp.]
RTDAWSIRATLRTSPADLVHLLSLMARGELVDQWSSNEMIAILEADQYNTLLPEPLPANIPIAHKTGSFFDTLNDAGIVFASEAPYVIAVMTTALPSKDLGRSFIHSISRLAYADELRFARWREATGTGVQRSTPSTSPDATYWDAPAGAQQNSSPPVYAPSPSDASPPSDASGPSDAPTPGDAPTDPPTR